MDLIEKTKTITDYRDNDLKKLVWILQKIN